MTRFDRYMLSQLMILFGFFSLVLVMIYWVNRAISLFDRLIADGQSAMVFLEFTALALPKVIRVVLPISAFIASVYVTNRMATESELVVMQSSGHGSFRLARPVAAFGVIVTCLLLILTNVISPAADRALSEREQEIARNVNARLLEEGQFLHPAPGVTFYIRDITPAGELLDIYLSDERDPDNPTTYTARRALLARAEDGPKLLMFEGLAQTVTAEDQRLFITRFDDFAYNLGNLITAEESRAPSPGELSTPELLAMPEARLAALGWERTTVQIEVHDRIAQPILALVTALAGFACLLLGGFSRFGVWRQIIIAILLLIGVKTFDNMVADTVRGGDGLWPLLYLPGVAGLGMVALILRLADRPALLARFSLFSRRNGAAA